MAIEETLAHLPPGQQRDRLTAEIAERLARGEWGDEDDDTLAALIRVIKPRGPNGRAGAAAVPEDSDLAS